MCLQRLAANDKVKYFQTLCLCVWRGGKDKPFSPSWCEQVAPEWEQDALEGPQSNEWQLAECLLTYGKVQQDVLPLDAQTRWNHHPTWRFKRKAEVTAGMFENPKVLIHIKIIQFIQWRLSGLSGSQHLKCKFNHTNKTICNKKILKKTRTTYRIGQSKMWVSRSALKVGWESISQMVCGGEFQRRGAEQLKALDPVEDKRAQDVMRSTEEEDWRAREGVSGWGRAENLESEDQSDDWWSI